MLTPRRRITFGNYSPCKSSGLAIAPDVSAFSVSASTRDYLLLTRLVFPDTSSRRYSRTTEPVRVPPGLATGLILARAERPIRHSEIVEAGIAGAHERSRGFVIPRSA